MNDILDNLIDRVSTILMGRWQDGLELFELMVMTAKEEPEYALAFEHYLTEGGTLKLRELVSRFGDYPHDVDFNNQVDAIDTSVYIARTLEPVDPVAYRLTRVGSSSDQYGICECCGEYVDSVYLLTQMRRYMRSDGRTESVTHHRCFQYFGHKDCLSSLTN
jgi:hypothetical protein